MSLADGSPGDGSTDDALEEGGNQVDLKLAQARYIHKYLVSNREPSDQIL